MAQGARPLLILCGAEARLTLTVCLGENLLAHQEWVVPGRAMQFLAPALADLLARQGLNTHDLGGLACVRGPGAFTGLRLVLATALGLGLGADLPMAGLDYLEILALGAAGLGRKTAVITHSRRGEVYFQTFIPEAEGAGTAAAVSADAPPLALTAPDAAKRLEALAVNAPAFALGSGIRRNPAAFAALPPDARILPLSFDSPRPEALIQTALAARYGQTPIEPLYVRGSDAEENLDVIAAGRGLDPALARAALDNRGTQPAQTRNPS